MYLWLICVPCKNKINSFQLSIDRPENVIQKLAKLIFIEYYFTWRMDRCRLHFWQGWLLAAVQWILLFLQTPLPWLSTFNWINCNKRRSLRNSITHFKSTFRYKRCTITQETKNAETKIFLLNYLVDRCHWTGLEAQTRCDRGYVLGEGGHIPRLPKKTSLLILTEICRRRWQLPNNLAARSFQSQTAC